MKIIETDLSMDDERMYCPSTDEVLYAPDFEEFNTDAKAFVAYWHSDAIEDPLIKDKNLAAAWEKLYDKWDELAEEKEWWEVLEGFFLAYDNPEWVVHECTFYGMACGPVSGTVYNVVKADTVVEDDPNVTKEDNEES